MELFSTQGLPTMIPITHPSVTMGEEDEENKPFKCSVCSKGFKLRSGLQQHERTHSSDRPYVCPDCGKLFRQPTHLQQHMRIHTGEKPYDCTFCDKSFRQRTILNQHLRIHTGEKPYVCMECGKQFRQKAILDQHYRTHLGDKPFACPHPACRKHFREMATLISHMKCHKDVPDPKIVLQQAKKMIKEEHDEYMSQLEGNNQRLENLTRPPTLGAVHGLPNPNTTPQVASHSPQVPQNQNLQEQNGSHPNSSLASRANGSVSENRNPMEESSPRYGEMRPYPSPNSSIPKSPHPLQSPPHSHTSSNGEPLSTDSNTGGVMAAPHMTMANLIPYPHSIFPAAASYMMSASSTEPRPYLQHTPHTNSDIRLS